MHIPSPPFARDSDCYQTATDRQTARVLSARHTDAMKQLKQKARATGATTVTAITAGAGIALAAALLLPALGASAASIQHHVQKPMPASAPQLFRSPGCARPPVLMGHRLRYRFYGPS